MHIYTYTISGTGKDRVVDLQGIGDPGYKYIFYKPLAPSKVTISKIKAKKKKITISWGAVSTADRYQVIVSTTKKFKKLTADKNTAKTSISIKVKKKKTYYVMVRAYVKDAAGEITCGPYSAVKKVKVK